MKGLTAPLAMILLLSSAPSHALQVEVGALGGAGLCFTYGSYLDGKAADLASQGAVGALLGSSVTRLLPGMSAGAYGDIALLGWLDLRLELRASYLGASRLALMGDGTPFNAYGAGLYALVLPVLARASLALGPGSLTVCLGPFYGLVVGGIRIQDTYAVTSTSAVVPLTLSQASMAGLSGGVGYRIALGPGVMSVELRADGTLLPVRLDAGLGAGDLSSLNALVLVGYGVTLGSADR